jgi:hypothetical protein
VNPAARGVLRLGAMFALGACLWVTKASLGPLFVPTVPLVVEVGPGEDVGAAVLFDHALRAGWVRTDPVVRRRLVDNLRFAGREGDEAALFGEALALGMDRADPVVRQRLVQRARDVLADVGEPSEQQLRDWLQAHEGDFAREPVLTIEQHPVGFNLASVPTRLVGTRSQLGARLGLAFGDELSGLVTGDEVEVASAFGVHRVRVVDAGSRSVPELDVIRAEVTQAWREAQRDAVVAGRLDELVAQYTVVTR